MSEDSNSATSAMLSMVTMDQHRIVLLIENLLHDRGHHRFWDSNFLGSRHVDHNVSDRVPLHEFHELRFEVLLDERAGLY